MPRTARRVLVFVGGLLLIVLGLVLVVLPGPLTIPPIVAGVWLWSREFEFAQKLMNPVEERGRAAWEQAKKAPIRTGVVTLLGLVGAGVLIWATLRYDLIDRGKELVGLG